MAADFGGGLAVQSETAVRCHIPFVARIFAKGSHDLAARCLTVNVASRLPGIDSERVECLERQYNSEASLGSADRKGKLNLESPAHFIYRSSPSEWHKKHDKSCI